MDIGVLIGLKRCSLAKRIKRKYFSFPSHDKRRQHLQNGRFWVSKSQENNFPCLIKMSIYLNKGCKIYMSLFMSVWIHQEVSRPGSRKSLTIVLSAGTTRGFDWDGRLNIVSGGQWATVKDVKFTSPNTASCFLMLTYWNLSASHISIFVPAIGYIADCYKLLFFSACMLP